MSARERREEKVCDSGIAEIPSSEDEEDRVNVPLAEIEEEEEEENQPEERDNVDEEEEKEEEEKPELSPHLKVLSWQFKVKVTHPNPITPLILETWMEMEFPELHKLLWLPISSSQGNWLPYQFLTEDEEKGL